MADDILNYEQGIIQGEILPWKLAKKLFDMNGWPDDSMEFCIAEAEYRTAMETAWRNGELKARAKLAGVVTPIAGTFEDAFFRTDDLETWAATHGIPWGSLSPGECDDSAIPSMVLATWAALREQEARQQAEQEPAPALPAPSADDKTACPNWEKMTPDERRLRVQEVVTRHAGSKAKASRELHISRQRVGQILAGKTTARPRKQDPQDLYNSFIIPGKNKRLK